MNTSTWTFLALEMYTLISYASTQKVRIRDEIFTRDFSIEDRTKISISDKNLSKRKQWE